MRIEDREANDGQGDAPDAFQDAGSESFLAFLASAYPLSPEDIGQWQGDASDSCPDIIDWLVETGRIDMRIGHVLLQFRNKTIDPHEARLAIESIQQEIESANLSLEVAAETTPAEGRNYRVSPATEAVTEGDEFSSSFPEGTPLPIPLPSPAVTGPTHYSAVSPHSKTEVSIRSDDQPTPKPAGHRGDRTPTQHSGKRDAGDYERLCGQEFGKYLICTSIGRGTMGAIMLGHHRLLGIPVAIKLLSPDLAHDDEFRERFFTEGRFAANIQHQALVHVFDCDERDGWLYLVMEYVDGMSGLELIRNTSNLPELRALRVVRRVAEGLAEAHRHGVIHRDVKPGNILFAKSGQVKLTDLGLARRVTAQADGQDEDFSGVIVGTPLYMAPEQTGADGTYDHRVDIYALGGTLYHFLAGVPAFNGESLMGLLRQHAESPVPPLNQAGVHVSARTAALVSWMLAKDPAERPADCAELIAELDACIESASRSRSNSIASAPAPRKSRPVSNFDPLGIGQKLSAILQGGNT